LRKTEPVRRTARSISDKTSGPIAGARLGISATVGDVSVIEEIAVFNDGSPHDGELAKHHPPALDARNTSLTPGGPNLAAKDARTTSK
jgi:hypothetical protein